MFDSAQPVHANTCIGIQGGDSDLSFQNIFLRAGDEIRLEMQSTEFPWKSNLN